MNLKVFSSTDLIYGPEMSWWSSIQDPDLNLLSCLRSAKLEVDGGGIVAYMFLLNLVMQT